MHGDASAKRTCTCISSSLKFACKFQRSTAALCASSSNQQIMFGGIDIGMNGVCETYRHMACSHHTSLCLHLSTCSFEPECSNHTEHAPDSACMLPCACCVLDLLDQLPDCQLTAQSQDQHMGALRTCAIFRLEARNFSWAGVLVSCPSPGQKSMSLNLQVIRRQKRERSHSHSEICWRVTSLHNLL